MNATRAMSPIETISPSASKSLQIQDLLAGNIRLASPPELFLRLKAVLDDPAKNVKDASILIEHDSGLTARLLKIVNSPFYGFPSKITSVHQAVSILGFRELEDLIVTTFAVDRFSSLSNHLMSMRDFWTMSTRGALTARALAHHHPDTQRLRAVFVCGLLHEIGRLVLYHRLPELARATVVQAQTEGITERASEQRTLGFDHYEIGAALARLWHLPEVISITIECHAVPERAGLYTRECALIVLSYRHSLISSPEQTCHPSDDEDLWNLLGMDPAILDEVMPRVEEQFREIFPLFFRADSF